MRKQIESRPYRKQECKSYKRLTYTFLLHSEQKFFFIYIFAYIMDKMKL